MYLRYYVYINASFDFYIRIYFLLLINFYFLAYGIDSLHNIISFHISANKKNGK